MTTSNRRRRAGTALAVALAVLAGGLPISMVVTGGVALAQGSGKAGSLTDDQKRRIKEHYEKANRYYLIGKYPEAIVEFEAAYLIGADPVMIFNIAQSYRLNNQPEEAARFYRNYLRSAPDASNRAEVEKKIADMDKRAAEKRQSAPVSPPVVEAPAPAMPPSSGVTPPATQSPPVPGTGPSSAGMPPTPAWTPGAPPSTSEPAGGLQSGPDTVERPSRVWPMVLMVGGGVLVVTSLALGGAAAKKAKDVEERAARRNLPFDADTQKLEKDGQAASGAAVVTGLLGLAAGTVGVIWWLRSAPAEATAAAPSPPTTWVAPLAGPGLYGASARVAF